MSSTNCPPARVKMLFKDVLISLISMNVFGAMKPSTSRRISYPKRMFSREELTKRKIFIMPAHQKRDEK